MSAEELQLTLPDAAFRQDFLKMAAEFHAAGEDWPHGAYSQDRRALDDFPRYLCELAEHAKGINLSPGRVPETTYWLLRASVAAQVPASNAAGVPNQSTSDAEPASPRLLGTLNLRHTLNDYLEYEGGHVGFCIRPSERGHGYAKAFLRLALTEARQLGLRRVLVTCTQGNLASAGVIRACGGQLEDERISRRHVGEIVQRYWIAL